VCSQVPVSSLPALSTRGTGVNRCAQASRSASRASGSPLPAGANFTKLRPVSSSSSNVSPPSTLSHTGRIVRPAATARTAAGTTTSFSGTPDSMRPPDPRRW
jgi:hypothetical protein